jgi:DNA-binding PadR family transcriptional regulator
MFEITNFMLRTSTGVVLSSTQRLNCIASNILDNSNKLQPIWTNDSKEANSDPKRVLRSVDDFKDLPINHAEKPIELLRLIAIKLKNLGPFDKFQFTRKDMFGLKIDGEKEATVWLDLLRDQGLISTEAQTAHADRSSDILKFPYFLTPKGWEAIENLFNNINSKKAFVAMAFRHDENVEIEKAIRAACVKTGWEPIVIRSKEYLGGITDEIIASIKQSRFVIAEFTGGNQGVYYEAGYATGRGLPVILAVKKSQLDDKDGLHFDTKHFRHIVWNDYADLENQLVNCIQAVIE